MATTETVQSNQQASERRPPKWLFKFVINPAMRFILRSPLHTRISDRLILLGFTGRKTGKQYVTPVGYHWEDGDIINFTQSPWARNLEGGAAVTVWLKGEKRQGTAKATQDVDEIVESLLKYGEAEGYETLRMRAPGVSFSGEKPTREELEASAENLTMVRTRLESPL